MRKVLITSLMLLAAPAFAAPPHIEAAVQDAARPEADTSRDDLRKPAELLEFAGIRPGMVVVDMLPGGGYFTRIFARAVGPKGQVYAYFGTQYDERLKAQGQDADRQFTDLKRVYSNLGVIHGPLENFVTPQRADVVWTSNNYHDLYNKAFGTNAAAVNKAVFASLKPGGIYMVLDHRAAKGAGPAVTESLHRMDADIARRDIEAAGFRLVSESKILAHPADDTAKRVFEQDVRGRTDQFVMKFVKPR